MKLFLIFLFSVLFPISSVGQVSNHHRPTHTKGPKRPPPPSNNLPDEWALETCYQCPLWPIDTDQNGMPFFTWNGTSNNDKAPSKLTEKWYGATNGNISFQAVVMLDPGVLVYDDDTDVPCPNTPFARPYFQRADWTNNDPDARWWATWGMPSIPVVNGTHVGTISFNDPSQWSNVYGQLASSRSAEFYNSLTNADRWGLTFGCGNHFGHGIYTDGNGLFHLQVFERVN